MNPMGFVSRGASKLLNAIHNFVLKVNHEKEKNIHIIMFFL